MTEDLVERRLATTLAADMVGYSRLMEADKRGTIARQKSHRTELIDPKIAQILSSWLRVAVSQNFAPVVDNWGALSRLYQREANR